MKLFIYFLITFFSTTFLSVSAQTENDDCNDTIRHYFGVSLTKSEYEILRKITNGKCVYVIDTACYCNAVQQINMQPPQWHYTPKNDPYYYPAYMSNYGEETPTQKFRRVFLGF